MHSYTGHMAETVSGGLKDPDLDEQDAICAGYLATLDENNSNVPIHAWANLQPDYEFSFKKYLENAEQKDIVVNHVKTQQDTKGTTTYKIYFKSKAESWKEFEAHFHVAISKRSRLIDFNYPENPNDDYDRTWTVYYNGKRQGKFYWDKLNENHRNKIKKALIDYFLD